MFKRVIVLGLLRLSHGEEALFSQSLNVAIHCSPFTKSHISAVLEISQVLVERGHTVTFAAFDAALKYSKGHNVSHYSFGESPGDPNVINAIVDDIMKESDHSVILKMVHKETSKFHQDIYRQSFGPFSDFIKSKEPDLLFCDHFSPVCIDVARVHGIPLIVGFQALGIYPLPTASYLTANMSPGHITTQEMPIAERIRDLYHKYYRNVRIFPHIESIIKQERKKRNIPQLESSIGAPTYGLSISSSFLGFEPAQPYSPNFQLMGPITKKSNCHVDENISRFLDSHKKILYIAFGSLFPVSTHLKLLISHAALDSLANGTIDGVVWGLGTTVLSPEINPENPHFKVVKWAPQQQILNHKHTKLFISHGGMNSCLEAIDSQTPVLGIGYVYDQQKNIAKLVHAKVALEIDPSKTSQAIQQQIETIIQDKEGTFKSNLERMKILAYYGQRRLGQAADMVEQHAYLAKVCRPSQPYDINKNLPPCELAHLVPAGHLMSFVKANNIDVYVILLIGAIATIWFSVLSIFSLSRAVFRSFKTKKSKSD